MEVTTIQKFIHTSPRKLRLVADMVRQMQPVKALDVLRVTPKAASKDLIKALESVLGNARRAGLDQANLNFKKIEVNESLKMRRFNAGTRGRVKPFKRRMSHIKIVLSDDLSNKVKLTSKTESENSEKKDRTGESGNENKSKKGGRTGLSE